MEGGGGGKIPADTSLWQIYKLKSWCRKNAAILTDYEKLQSVELKNKNYLDLVGLFCKIFERLN